MSERDKVKDAIMISRVTEAGSIGGMRDMARKGLRNFCDDKGYDALAGGMAGAEDKYLDPQFLQRTIEGDLPLSVQFSSRLGIALDKVSPGTSLESFIPFRDLEGELAYRKIAKEVYGKAWDVPIEKHHQEAMATLRLIAWNYAWVA